MSAPSPPKLSAVLLDWVTPLFVDAPADLPLHAREAAMQIAITVWNALVVREGGGPDVLPELHAKLDAFAEPGRTQMRQRVAQLVARKARLYPNERRGVGDWKLRRLPDGGISLWVEARGP